MAAAMHDLQATTGGPYWWMCTEDYTSVEELKRNYWPWQLTGRAGQPE